MKRVLITGGAGFVGSSLALRFKYRNPDVEVICMDNLYRKGSELNCARLENAGITFLKSDVRHRDSFNIASCDLVIDAAAEPSVMAGDDGDAEYVVDTNLGGTINLLEAARKWGAAFLFLSTSRVYPVELLQGIVIDEADSRFEIAEKQSLPGVSADGIAEEFPLDLLNATGYTDKAGGRTFYGATKYASEVMVREYAAYFGVRTVVNRCGVLAGPWQMGKVDQGVTALWVAAHIYGKKLAYIGYGGKQVRDVLHVDDLADLIFLQLERMDLWNGEVYNIGGGRDISFSLRELTELTEVVTGKSLNIGVIDTVRAGDIPLYLTNTDKVMRTFGWEPRKMAVDIVEDIGKWIYDNKDMLHFVLG